MRYLEVTRELGVGEHEPVDRRVDLQTFLVGVAEGNNDKLGHCGEADHVFLELSLVFEPVGAADEIQGLIGVFLLILLAIHKLVGIGSAFAVHELTLADALEKRLPAFAVTFGDISDGLTVGFGRVAIATASPNEPILLLRMEPEDLEVIDIWYLGRLKVVELLSAVVRVEHCLGWCHEIDSVVVVFVRVNRHNVLALLDGGPRLAMVARKVGFPAVGSHDDGLVVAFAGLTTLEIVVLDELLALECGDFLVDLASCRRGLGLVALPLDRLIFHDAISLNAGVTRDQSVTRGALERVVALLASTLRRLQRTARLTLSLVVLREVEITLVVPVQALAVLRKRERIFPLFAHKTFFASLAASEHLSVAHDTLWLAFVVLASIPLFEIILLALAHVDSTEVNRDKLMLDVGTLALVRSQDEFEACRIGCRGQGKRVDLVLQLV